MDKTSRPKIHVKSLTRFTIVVYSYFL